MQLFAVFLQAVIATIIGCNIDWPSVTKSNFPIYVLCAVLYIGCLITVFKAVGRLTWCDSRMYLEDLEDWAGFTAITVFLHLIALMVGGFIYAASSAIWNWYTALPT